MKLAIAFAALAASASAAAADPGRHSMKGWELYTWFDLSCSASAQVHSAPNDDSWCAALVPGTNRVKSVDEVKRARIKWRDLATALGGLASGEDVAWVRTPRAFDLPGAALRDPIAALAKQRGVALAVVDRK